MKRKWTIAAALSGLLLLPVAGCPFINPPPDPPKLNDLGALVRTRLTDKDETAPIDIDDDAEFDIDDEKDDFADVLSDPKFDVD